MGSELSNSSLGLTNRGGGAAAQVREDLGDVLERVQAEWDPEKEEPVVQFRGWARMALPIAGFDIIEVKAPKVGETKPAAVTADIVISTHGAAPSPSRSPPAHHILHPSQHSSCPCTALLQEEPCFSGDWQLAAGSAGNLHALAGLQ